MCELVHDLWSLLKIDEWDVDRDAAENETNCEKIFDIRIADHRSDHKEDRDQQGENRKNDWDFVRPMDVSVRFAHHEQCHHRSAIEEPNEKRCEFNQCCDVTNKQEQQRKHALKKDCGS